jgi:hypothetical protein
MMFRPSVLLLALVLVAVPVLAGCSVDTSDSVICDPVACHYNPNYSPPPSPAPADTSSGPDDWWWNVSPCSLMTNSELRRLGLPAGPGYPILHAVSDDGTSRESDCLWGVGASTLFITLVAEPYTTLGETVLGPVPGDTAFRTADGRPGTIFPQLENAGSCHVAFQATRGSSAVVQVDRRHGTQVCDLTIKVANLVAPELPPSSRS